MNYNDIIILYGLIRVLDQPHVMQEQNPLRLIPKPELIQLWEVSGSLPKG